MIREYFVPLRGMALNDNAALYRPVHNLPETVTLESSAMDVMTDLKQVPAQTVEPEASIEEAKAKMIRQGVRLLFVTDAEYHLLGIVTATDIQSDRVVQVMHVRNVLRNEVIVKDIMTPRDHIEAIDMHEVRGAKVGHVLATLKQTGRQHALVVEVDVDHRPLHERLTTPRPEVLHTVTGLFSLTQIARQLGLQPQPDAIATTFAEVEAMLAH
ncbi:MAG TPA: CBS domain-containing protein [Burkholderiales bacterium]|nr:CBS domain-containing protein [Burkholderiales bacterium]